MNKFRDSLFFQLIPLFLVQFIFFFTQDEITVILVMLLMLGLSFLIKYEKNEWILFIFGVILGLHFEIGGDLIYSVQNWENAHFLSIPLWVPVIWGYGFIFIRRIGNRLITLR